jgi:formate dehydrogenase subunit gamma
MRNRRCGGLGFGAFLLALALTLGVGVGSGLLGTLATKHAAFAQRALDQPPNALGDMSKSDEWRKVRQGLRGDVSIPNKQAGVLIQSDGENFRNLRNGPLSTYGSWLLLGVIAAIALFFAVRGRIRIERGRSGVTIERFNGIERFTHWMTATSFVILALSGLNMLYGRYVLKPLIGADAFAGLTQFGKFLHNYLAFAFMLGILIMLVLWVRDNLPDRHDAHWLIRAGGFFSRHSHPSARKFNAGQKLLFWLVILGGISASLSGVALLFPFEFAYFSKTFAVLNLVGAGLPTDLTPLQETQLSQVWHAIIGLLLIAVIIGHIYIGTLGMEGAFDAMGTGRVDANWAREHHDLWVAEMERRAPAGEDD